MAKDKISFLDKGKELYVSSYDGASKKQVVWPGSGSVDMLFPGPLGKVLVQSGENIALFDLSAGKVVAEMSFPDVKQVYWTHNFNCVALFSHSCKEKDLMTRYLLFRGRAL